MVGIRLKEDVRTMNFQREADLDGFELAIESKWYARESSTEVE